MFSLDEIILIKESNYSNKELIYKLYRDNIGLISKVALDMSTNYTIHQDYMQIGYLALELALRKYQIGSEFSFLSYFRRCFLHEMFKFNLQYKYPFSINEYQRKIILDNNIKIVIESIDSVVAYEDMSDKYYIVEQKLLRSQVLKECQRILEKYELLYVLYRFYGNNSRSGIARTWNITYSRMRSFEISILQKLKRSFTLKCIAHDYFDINVM